MYHPNEETTFDMTTHIVVTEQDGVLYALCGFISPHDADFTDDLDAATCPPCREHLAGIDLRIQAPVTT